MMSRFLRPPSALRALLTLVLCVWLALVPSRAQATVCDTFAVDEMWCNDVRIDAVSIGDGLWSLWNYDACGVAPDYMGAQDAWEIHCARSGQMTITLELLEACDLDLFLLTDTCDGAAECVAHSRRVAPQSDTLTFACVEGETYYGIVEPFSSPACALDFSWEYRITAACREGTGTTCADGVDNDGDGATDCRDSECPACAEVCDNGRDDDRDGLSDCSDPSCSRFPACCDRDNDGYWATGAVCAGNDCNDNNANIRPNATEVPADGIDQNCDAREACYVDVDRDTYGATATGLTATMSCIDPANGYANNARDCADTNALVNPAATEVPTDGRDGNCDGREACWRDGDQDDYGVNVAELSTDLTCRAGTAAPNTLDCNDANATVNPGVQETTADGSDRDCDGLEACWVDVDGDNFGGATTVTSTDLTCLAGNAAPVPGDCDDANNTINPAATETPGDGVDQNCDTRELCYRDGDGDQWGRSGTVNVLSLACTGGAYTSRAGDCNDASATVNPGATETPANGVDQDCDGLESCYQDVDLDDFGTTTRVTSADLTCRAGAVAPNSTDCNDTNAAINPTAVETAANRTDENCDGKEACWTDADGDTWGSNVQLLSTNMDCAAVGVSARSGDCNDAAASVSPTASEVAGDLIDQNCDGQELCWVDADADGVGGGTSGVADAQCRNAGFSATTGDCADTNPTIRPGLTEIPVDGVDQDCDGLEACWRDNDRDDYGTAIAQTSTDFTCKRGAAAPNTTDCNDNAVSVNPGANEVTADGVDQNCDGVERCWLDADLDDYGVSGTTVNTADLTCRTGTAAPNTTDCNDASAAIHPGATEVPADRTDQNCDGRETCFRDIDGDTFGSTTTVSSADLACDDPGLSSNTSDCNDASAAIRPTAAELAATGVDENCDGQELCYLDNDRDTYGSTQVQASNSLTCTVSGVSSNRTDCNDGNAAIHPGAFDDPNTAADENCDGARPCWQDQDRDGWGSATVIVAPGGTCTAGLADRTGDCDDDPLVGARAYPGAPESPGDGVDADCNGQELCFVDADLDTWGLASATTPSTSLACAGSGIAARAGDCNDAFSAIYPGATELAADGIDQDCNNSEVCYRDGDGDGYGTTATTLSLVLTCTAPGSSPRADDCQDTPGTGASIHPNAAEVVANATDEDCDGLEACWVDGDRDSVGSGISSEIAALTCAATGFSASTGDCNDADPAIRPGAAELIADGVDTDCDGAEICLRDLDRDGFGSTDVAPSTALDCAADGFADDDDDCNDAIAAIFPGATEAVADGVDQSCDGLELCYVDADVDGWGASRTTAVSTLTCLANGVAPQAGDCDDARASVHPAADEITANGVDETCDGLELCWVDADLDGFGGANAAPAPDLGCTTPGFAPTGNDCNDADPLIKPGAIDDPATEADEDCDGLRACWVDADGDGFGGPQRANAPGTTCEGALTTRGGDCNDASNTVNPGANERPANGVDDNCDAQELCFEDADDDDWGSEALIQASVLTCSGVGIAPRAGDCNDTSAEIRPFATEIVANGVDEDCDGGEACHPDGDDDGYGVPGVPVRAAALDCNSPGASARIDDCNDNNPAVHPNATEQPASGVDEDCDGQEACWRDSDEDRYGGSIPAASTSFDCSARGVSPVFTDCNDLDPAMHPGGEEIVANSVDEDCDGYEMCFRDHDGDAHGTAVSVASTSLTCDATGFSPVSDDCDDSRADVHPGATEVDASGVDEDCNGEERCFIDGDLDGYGRAAVGLTTDTSCRTSGWSLTADDCRDAGPGAETVHPDAAEVPGNGVDEDCDGQEACFVDGDGDGFGGTAPILTPLLDCALPGASASGSDCDDGNDAIHPGAAEAPADGVDADCDRRDACYQDADGDGAGTALVILGVDLTCGQPGESRSADDCLDRGSVALPPPYTGAVDAAHIGPSAPEVCNGVDDDCDARADDADDAVIAAPAWFTDADGDGYGDPLAATNACLQPPSSSARDGDCADTEPAIHPDAQERCDGVDNDCDRLIDAADDDVTDARAWWVDADRDGHGTTRLDASVQACGQPVGYAATHDDCADDDRDRFPGNPEIPYDLIDQDCANGDLADLDGDGFLSSRVPNGADCNDLDSAVSPAADETANGVDDDCNGAVDDGTRRSDDDGDGFTEAGGDCNDDDAFVNPAGVERCDGRDEDCDGVIDQTTVCVDDDRDGYAEADGDCNDDDQGVHPGRPEIDDNGVDDNCDGTLDRSADDPDGDGWSALGGDCNPSDPGTRPGAPELPDGLDNDCDGRIDEGTRTFDDDGDGYAELLGDCDDGDLLTNPGAIEQPNGRDDDCDGDVDEGTDRFDDDRDGIAESGGDCDDADDGVRPGATETVNGIDDDCNGDVDDVTVDADGDGFTVAEGDCNDQSGWVRPDLDDWCDGVDNDCDGEADPDCIVEVTDPLEVKGCACDGNGAPSGASAAVFAALVLATRRRRDRRSA